MRRLEALLVRYFAPLVIVVFCGALAVTCATDRPAGPLVDRVNAVCREHDGVLNFRAAGSSQDPVAAYVVCRDGTATQVGH